MIIFYYFSLFNFMLQTSSVITNSARREEMIQLTFSSLAAKEQRWSGRRSSKWSCAPLSIRGGVALRLAQSPLTVRPCPLSPPSPRASSGCLRCLAWKASLPSVPAALPSPPYLAVQSGLGVLLGDVCSSVLPGFREVCR